MSSRSEAPSDGSHLGDSTYEFIDTDEESRDDNATESIASTDVGRPDDVASLADTEHSGEDSADEDNHDTAYPGLHHSDENAFSTPTLGLSSTAHNNNETFLTRSIEFEESTSLDKQTVSVKHTVVELDEEQTINTVKAMKLPNPPNRLVVTIRQTMTKNGLSTRDPLRILYVGSHSAKQDIIHKIASSITASAENGKRDSRQGSAQLYNVVPVSAFGSDQTPEIELMHSSGYQIKVEDCTAAQSLEFEDSPQKPEVVKLTTDDNSYHSVPEGDGFIVEPQWELPHVAVFYCSDSDSTHTRQTRSLARKFMSRHEVPSIVISHRQLFDRGLCMSLDQHSIHMCLESRNANGRGSIVHQRLPIDLASFLNIDARQMNRNLAYLTGLHEEELGSWTVTTPTTKRAEVITIKGLDRTSQRPSGLYNDVSDWCNRTRNIIWEELRTIVLASLVVSILGYLTIVPSNTGVSTVPSISINSNTMSAVAISSTTTRATPLLPPSITSSTLAAKTSTPTVATSQQPGPNSLSIVPSMDLGKVSKTSTKSQFNKSICSAEILGDREILIRIPSATKLSWLMKEAMNVIITRDNMTVDTERAYSINEGVVLQLAKKEAFGVLNISIVTSKKPRVNETFQVDFGTSLSRRLDTIVDKLRHCSSFPRDITIVDPKTISELRAGVNKMFEEARSTIPSFESAKKIAIDQASIAGESITEVAKSISLEAAKCSAIVSKEVGLLAKNIHIPQMPKTIQYLQQWRDPLDNGILKAQIRSKLLWLKIQGRDTEYQHYKQRAIEALQRQMQKSQSRKKIAHWKKRLAAKKEAQKARKEAEKRQRTGI